MERGCVEEMSFWLPVEQWDIHDLTSLHWSPSLAPPEGSGRGGRGVTQWLTAPQGAKAPLSRITGLLYSLDRLATRSQPYFPWHPPNKKKNLLPKIELSLSLARKDTASLAYVHDIFTVSFLLITLLFIIVMNNLSLWNCKNTTRLMHWS